MTADYLRVAFVARRYHRPIARIMPSPGPTIPFIALLSLCCPAASGQVPVVEIELTAAAPRIDGRLDDPAWASASVITDLRQVVPVEDALPSEATEVRVLYDREHLYVGIRCFDREPGRIIAARMRRDIDLVTDDHVRFVIDPFLDRRNGFLFEMNAVGARVDALVEDNRRERRDWDGIWEGRASIDEKGWVAEFAIPFQTISFDPRVSGWGFNVERFIRRRNETVRWSGVSQDKSFLSIADAGVLEGLENLRQGIGLDVKPFGLATWKYDNDRDRDGLDADAGLDVFYKITPSLTLALTFNTDFAETEVDDRRVNLTRFPLFFPEKRDFFLQDAGIFNFGGINRNPLPFFSRRIGLDAAGETVDILAGAKLTGRVGDVSVGLLDVQMQHDDELGDKNHFVGRVSLNVLEESRVGAIFTHGDPQTDRDNTLGGLDFVYYNSSFAGDKVVTGSAWMQVSDTSGRSGLPLAYGGKLGYPNDRVDWEIGYTEIPEDFNAALGFVPRRGIREYFANWRYRWRFEHGVVRTIDSGAGVFLITDLDDDVESQRLSFEALRVSSQAGDSVSLELSSNREVLSAAFEISDGVTIPVGDYRFDRYAAGITSSRGRPVSAGFVYRGGDFYSGTRDDYVASLDWRVSRHLELGGELELNDVDLEEGSFITRVVRARVNVFFTPDVSWSNFVQFDNVSDILGINSRFRWIIEPGSEIFVVLNQSLGREDGRFRGRQTDLTTKVGWTFRF